MYRTIKMNGVEHNFECDSGSKVTIMNDEDLKRLKLYWTNIQASN